MHLGSWLTIVFSLGAFLIFYLLTWLLFFFLIRTKFLYLRISMCLGLFHLFFFVTVCVNVRIALRIWERCVSFGDSVCVCAREFFFSFLWFIRWNRKKLLESKKRVPDCYVTSIHLYEEKTWGCRKIVLQKENSTHRESKQWIYLK